MSEHVHEIIGEIQMVYRVTLAYFDIPIDGVSDLPRP